jgi:hypothetical protein
MQRCNCCDVVLRACVRALARSRPQVCGKPVTTTHGKCLRPESGRIILYLKGLNLPK